MIVAVVLTVLLAASAYPQATDFFELAKTGTPQSIQAVINQGATVSARNRCHLTEISLPSRACPDLSGELHRLAFVCNCANCFKEPPNKGDPNYCRANYAYSGPTT